MFFLSQFYYNIHFKPFPPATALFTGIGVLLGVSPFRDTLVCIFETFKSGGERCYRELRNAC